MPHLLRPRKGWENESLASYLLSRFSFIAHPASVADDLGSDFFCTIFEIASASGTDVLVPRSSFALQVKSSASRVCVDNKIEYLLGLELPFFIGVVRQSPSAMDVYSAELLPPLFSDRGKPNRLWLSLVSASSFDPNHYFELRAPGEIRLMCPLVATLSVDDDRSAVGLQAEALIRICKRAQSNIAARLSEEHIYDVDGKGNLRILAGPGSVQYFRLNLLKRLGECFFNLKWILDSAGPEEFPMAEFVAFESLYHSLKNVYGSMPNYVSLPYSQLKASLGSVPL